MTRAFATLTRRPAMRAATAAVLAFTFAAAVAPAADATLARDRAVEVGRQYMMAWQNALQDPEGIVRLHADDAQFCVGSEETACHSNTELMQAFAPYAKLLSAWTLGLSPVEETGVIGDTAFFSQRFSAAYFCNGGGISQAEGRITALFNDDGTIARVFDAFDYSVFATAMESCAHGGTITPVGLPPSPHGAVHQEALVNSDVLSWTAAVSPHNEVAAPFPHVDDDAKWCIASTCGDGRDALLAASSGYSTIIKDMAVHASAVFRGKRMLSYEWTADYLGAGGATKQGKGFITMILDSRGRAAEYYDFVDADTMDSILNGLTAAHDEL